MATPPPPITPVPTPAPQRGDRATFSDRVDAFVTWLEGAGAEFEAVAENVYENATIAEASGDLASVGLGITTAAPYMPNVDNVGVAAGFWYIDGATIGTLPLAASPAMIFHKVYGTNGFQLLNYANSDRLFFRRRTGSAWQTWQEAARISDLTAGLATKANSGTNTDITALNAVQHIGMAGPAPIIDFDENDQTGAAGLWRMTFQGDAWTFAKNTAVAGDFSTSVVPFSATAAGVGQVNGATPVQQGTGVGQGANVVKLGWSTTGGGGLRCTVDSTDQGYLPFSSTNAHSGGMITYANPLSVQATTVTTLTASGILIANAGAQINNAGALITGGSLATLANNGYLQTGINSSLNLVFDYTNIQARSNGAATTLNLNSLGGLVQVGAGGLTSTGTITTSGQVFSKTALAVKMVMQNGATTDGNIGANASFCFFAANNANTIYSFTADNSGNFTATGNITANSDERLKKDWEDLPEDFLHRLARVKHGTFTRIDTGERQAGSSAQDFQAFLPEVVPTHPESGILSLAYGNAALLAAIKLAQKVEVLEQRILDLEKAANK